MGVCPSIALHWARGDMRGAEKGRSEAAQATAGKKPFKHVRRRSRRLIRKVGRSGFVTSLAGAFVYHALRFVGATQSRAEGSTEERSVLFASHPAIIGLWHGQHLLAPLVRPKDLPSVALLSRNADAELNARVVERFGASTVRGSGGREGETRADKGGARALIALRRALGTGRSVVMIADISKGAPRQAGLGIVTLAKISGRPILPSAAVTSRRHVVASSWDRTTIPLPFGRMAVVIGDPIHVPMDADAAILEAKRKEVTDAIEWANRLAIELAGTKR